MQAEQSEVPTDPVQAEQQPIVQDKVEEPAVDAQPEPANSPIKDQAPVEEVKQQEKPIESAPQEDAEMRPTESTQAEPLESQPIAEQVQAQPKEQQAPAPQVATLFIPKPSDQEALKQQQETGFVYVDANIYQAAMLNKKLPQGYRIDLEDVISKQIKQRADALKNSLKNAKKIEAQRNRAINRQLHQQQAHHSKMISSEVVSNVGAHASNGALASSVNINEQSENTNSAAINTNINGDIAMANQATSNQDQSFAASDKPVAQTASASFDVGQSQAQQPLPLAMTPSESVDPKEAALNDTPAAEGKRSTRERKAVDYNSMASGTGQSSAANMAYPEIQPIQRQPSTIKKPGQKLVQEIFRKCCDLLRQLKEKPGADFLEKPLDPAHVKYEDLKKDFKLLSLVEKNLHDQKYQTTYNMALDLRKMFTNRIRQFQISDCEVSTKILDISTWFEEIFESMDLDNKNIYVVTQTAAQSQAAQQKEAINAQTVKRQASQIQKLEKKVAQIVSKNDRKKTPAQQPSNKQITTSNNNSASVASNGASTQQVQAPKEDSITMEEKTRIKNNIQYLTNVQQQGIIDLVKDCINQKSGHVFEFELDQLPVDKCRSLEKYVTDCIRDNERKRKRRQSDQQRRQRQKQLKQLNEQQQQSKMQQPSNGNQASAANAQSQQKQYEQMPVEQLAALLVQNPNLPISDKKRNTVNQYQVLQKQQQQQAIASSQNQAQQQVVNQPNANKKRGNGGGYQSDQSSSSSSDTDEGFPPQKNAGASQQANNAAEGDITQMWSNIQSSQQANK